MFFLLPRMLVSFIFLLSYTSFQFIYGGIMETKHLIGRLIRIGRSDILELHTDIAGFYFENSLYFSIGEGRYTSRRGFHNVELFEVESSRQ